MSVLGAFQKALEILPVLARFAVMMALIVVIPRLSRRIRLPEAVGLLLSGVGLLQGPSLCSGSRP